MDRQRPRWLRSSWWDTALLAYPWVPFYAFFVFGLGLDGSWDRPFREDLKLATVVALGCSYVHRHYTFLLVYGDRPTFEEHKRAYSVVPACLFVLLAVVIRNQGDVRLDVPGVRGGLRPWMLVLVITGAWNMWHTLMQRHGIFRIYGGRAGGGLQSRAQGRADKGLLWSWVLLTAALTLLFRSSTFAGIGNARRLQKTLDPIVNGASGWAILGVSLIVAGWATWHWVRLERAADLTWAQRRPRLVFLSSTGALLLVFVVHGPVVGYLCFGTAHALEYVAFFHHFGQKKFEGREDPGLVGRVLARPIIYAPLMIGSLVLIFFLLRDVRRAETYVVYYTGTSLLHFLYDGWIWKVRKPAVARPLGVQS